MNISLFYFFHSFAFQSPWLDSVIWFFAEPFIYIMIVVALIFIFVHYRLYDIKNLKITVRNTWKEIIYIPFSAGLARLITEILKNVIHTNRPPIALPQTIALFTESGYAFPSGHATIIAALAFAIYFKNKKLGYVFMVAALLIGIARVASGVHFLIDIIGGYLIGFVVAFFVKSR